MQWIISFSKDKVLCMFNHTTIFPFGYQIAKMMLLNYLYFMISFRYGVGYHLTVVKDPNCNVDNVTSLVERMVTGATISTNIGSELSFTLPSQSSHQFAELFDSFDCKY